MCFPNCAKYLLVLLNVAIFVAGGALFVAGMLLLLESGIMDSSVLKLMVLIQYNNSTRFGLILMIAGYMLIAVGGLIMVVAVLGMAGAWKKIKCCLLVFIICTVLTILLEATIAGLYINLNARSDEWLQGEMLTLLKSYKGPQATDETSTGFNKLFMKARCCCVTSTSDFASTTWKTANAGKDVPETCCKGVDTDDEIAKMVTTSDTCTSNSDKYYTDGCYTVIKDEMFTYLLIVCIVCAAALLLEVAAVVLSCIVLDQTKNRIRHANLGGTVAGKAMQKPYLGLDAVLKSKGKL